MGGQPGGGISQPTGGSGGVGVGGGGGGTISQPSGNIFT